MLEAVEFWPSSPAVMLSPKARNDVVVSRGGSRTVTENEQDAVRCDASVTVQVTVFCPIAKGDPGGGVQAVVTGSLPLLTIGSANVTAAGPPSIDCAVCAAGQMMVGGSGVGGTGTGTGVGAAAPPQAVKLMVVAAITLRKKSALHTKKTLAEQNGRVKYAKPCESALPRIRTGSTDG
jgi:hypothetical protein